jgi:hypothetical protein
LCPIGRGADTRKVLSVRRPAGSGDSVHTMQGAGLLQAVAVQRHMQRLAEAGRRCAEACSIVLTFPDAIA